VVARVLEGVIDPVAHLVPDNPADADPAGLGQGFQPRGYVHTVAEDVVFLSDHVAKVDADAECDTPLLWRFGVTVGHAALDLNGATHRIDHAWKFRQQSVAGILYRMAAVLLDLGLNQLAEMRLEPLVRPLLIRAHQARVPRHVGGEDRGEAADRRHELSGGRLA
jgi:hypothetical protein